MHDNMIWVFFTQGAVYKQENNNYVHRMKIFHSPNIIYQYLQSPMKTFISSYVVSVNCKLNSSMAYKTKLW
jgi:hypothetical protein